MFQWMFIQFKDEILEIGGESITALDVMQTVTEHYDWTSGKLDLNVALQRVYDDVIDSICIDITGIEFDLVKPGLPKFEELIIDAPGLGRFVNWIMKKGNVTDWAWLSVGIGPHLTVAIEDWADNAAAYILQESVFGSPIIDDVLGIFYPWGGVVVDLARQVTSMASTLVEYNQFAEHYNQLRVELILGLTAAGDDLADFLTSFIEPSQLLINLPDELEELGFDLSSLDNINELFDGVDTAIKDGIIAGLDVVIDAVKDMPSLPNLSDWLVEILEEVDLTFSWSDPSTWDNPSFLELFELLTDLLEHMAAGDPFFVDPADSIEIPSNPWLPMPPVGPTEDGGDDSSGSSDDISSIPPKILGLE
jgi:hypothetical protein